MFCNVFCRGSARACNYRLAIGEKIKAEKEKNQALGKCRKMELRANRLASKTESVQQLKKTLHDVEKAQEASVRSLTREVVEMQGDVQRIAAERDRLLHHNKELQQDLAQLQSEVEDVKAGKSAVLVSKMLGVSPESMKHVESSSKGSYLESWTLDEAAPPAEGQRPNGFLERVTTVLSPAVEKICAMAKFKGKRTDIPGVARLLLRKVQGRRYKAKRQLFNGGAPRGISHDLDSLLKEMATAWRQAFRNKERQAAASLLQMTLQAIPKRRGKCVCVCVSCPCTTTAPTNTPLPTQPRHPPTHP